MQTTGAEEKMVMTIKDERGLAQALKDDNPRIEIEGDLGKKVLRIHATGAAAWVIAFGAIAVAVGAVIAICATGGAAAVPASGLAAVSAPAAVAILGVPAATTAIAVAFAAKSAGVLKKLRKYSVSEENGKVILTK